MDVRVLDGLAVDGGLGHLDLRGRALVVVLALASPAPVDMADLTAGLWGPRAGAPARDAVERYAAELGRAPGPLVARTGDALTLGPEVTTDLQRVASIRSTAQAQAQDGVLPAARATLHEALELFGEEPLAEFDRLPFAADASTRLADLRAEVEEDVRDLSLRLGGHAALVGELEAAVATRPDRARTWAQLMTALHRAGRSAEALAAFARARRHFAEDLGTDPDPALESLAEAIRADDPDLRLDAGPGPDGDPTGGPLWQGAGHAVGAVPRPATPTFGRDALLEDLSLLLALPGVRLVSLLGPGGSGKSRLAVLAALATADHGSRFARRTYLVATELVDSLQLARETVHALTGQDAPEADPLTALGEVDLGPALLVLDNLEVIDDAAALLPALLDAAPWLTLLVTTRLPLGIADEHEFAVPPLEVPEAGAPAGAAFASPAVELFDSRARALDRSFDLGGQIEDVAAICRFVDGLPLAIELAAARTRTLTPRQILQRISTSLDLLTTRAPDVPSRQQTLAATIDWSLDRLPPASRTVCERATLFERGFDLDGLEAVCPEVTSCVDALGPAIEARLVRPVPSAAGGRFMVSGSVRAHTLSRPGVRGEVEGHRHRLVAYLTTRYVRLAADLDGPDGGRVLQCFDDEQADLAGAFEWALEQDRADLALDLGRALHHVWVARGWLNDGIERLHRARRVLTLDDEQQAVLHVLTAQLAHHLSLMPEVITQCEPVAGLTSDPDLIAEAGCYSGGALILTGDPDNGAPLVQAALEAAEQRDLYPLRAVALSMLAIAAAIGGDFDAERRLHEQRLEVAQARGDGVRTSDALNILAEIALDDDDHLLARAYLETALGIAEDADLPVERRELMLTLGRTELLAGDTRAATRALRTALALVERTGQRLALAQLLRAGGCLAARLGDHVTATRLFAAAQRTFPSVTGGEDLIEVDLQAGLQDCRDTLGAGFDREWRIGATVPPATVRRSLADLLVGRTRPGVQS